MTEQKLRIVNFFVVLLVLCLITFFFYKSRISYRYYYSIFLSGLYTTTSFFISIWYIKKAEKKNLDKVIGTIFTGMGIRLMVLILLIIISINFLDINENSFIFSILIFYIYYLTIEIIFVNLRA